ncbi:VOC family protein [Halorarum halobium]|uniref:VOC family protein n=1 Tax=Halorarum halobium TaxID=3075121 RepID=UPI0028A6B6D2|nr:VOC family protein [Halobaculum sp. XH14]
MSLTIDHVTVAGRDLDALAEAFTEAGLAAEYGGTHSNGVTHMASVGFRDGSYVELVSTVESDADSSWWDDPIHENGGPCGWAVRADDIDAETERLRERGVAVDGPHGYERERPDGSRVAWDLAFLDDRADPGATLPFLISDRTPRERRVEPTGELAGSPVRGVDTVVLGVPDLAAARDRLTAAFDLADPERGRLPSMDVELARFADAPVALTEPTGDGPLADRLDRFGPRPVAYLLGVDGGGDGDAGEGNPFADVEFEIDGRESFKSGTVGWLPLTEPVGRPYVGLIDG